MKVDPATLNTQFLAKIAAGEVKGAADAGTEFTRLTLREEGLLRKILPPKTITPSDLDKQLDTDKPVKILDKEVSQPLSASVPFGSLPVNQYIRGSRYRVDFARLVTPNYTKDVIELGQYDYDIREIFKDNAIKDHMTAEDVPFFALINAIISNDPDNGTLTGNAASAMTGKVQYYDFTDATKNPYGLTGFSRDSLVSFLTIMPRGYGDSTVSTPIRLQTDLCVMNVNTGKVVFREQIGREAMDQPGIHMLYLLYLTFLSSDSCEYLLEYRRLILEERYRRRIRDLYSHTWKTATKKAA